MNGLTSILGTAANLFTGRSAMMEIGPGWCEIKEIFLDMPDLPPEFDGYRIAQISDLHLGSWMDGNRLSKVSEMVNQLKPDLIAITGDFISSADPALKNELIDGLSHLHAPDGIAAVFGNHDHRHGLTLVTEALLKVGIEILINRSIPIQRGDAKLWLAGTDSHTVGLADVGKILSQLPSSGTAILLVHEPDFADISAKTGRFDLQLSGHTHGGQIVLPVLGRLYLPRFGRKYPSGKYELGKMTLYTNRGIGMIHFILRLNCLPEITLFKLQSKMPHES